MQILDEPLETIHIYYEGERPPSLFPIWLSLFVFFCLLLAGTFPFPKSVTRETIKVPAILLPLRTLSTSVKIIPTGKKTIPATRAHGILTITNGSIISQIIPPGFIVDGVATDTSVFVPAGSANGYGYATVAAHSLLLGKKGNILRSTIDTVVNSSIYIRNLTAFRGGADAYSVRFVTLQDRHSTLEHVRQRLLQLITGLHYPCRETVNHTLQQSALQVVWKCQFVKYSIPALYHVTGVRLLGKTVLVDVWFVARPIPFPVK